MNKVIKLREISLSTVEMYVATNYPCEGFYVNTDENGYETVIFMSKQLNTGGPIATYLGDADYIKRTVIKQDHETFPGEGKTPYFNAKVYPGSISEDFAMDMLSIVLHGCKAKDLKK